jgi:hypothetical protein
MKIALISCSKSKRKGNKSTTPDKLYTSPLFRKQLEKAKELNADKIFVLSTKYGLMGMNERHKPYNQVMMKKSAKQQKVWDKRTLNELERY